MSAQDGAGAPNAAVPEDLDTLRERLAILQQINELTTKLNPTPIAQTTGARPVMHIKVPEGSYSMSPAEYRTYKKDCESYRTLSNLTDHQVVLQIRMNMDSDLKRIIDTNHPDWDTKTVNDAVQIVGDIVNEISNPVVYQNKFNQMNQTAEEPIREYLTRLRICAMDCDFKCPFDAAHDLTDYMIINRINTAVYDSTLQQEVLQKYASLNTVDQLLTYCENYESTKRDTDLLKGKESASTVAANSTDDLSQDEIIAAISAYKKNKKLGFRNKQSKDCQRCGQPKHQDSEHCPATGKTCLRCGRSGHYATMCHSKTDEKSRSRALTSAAVIINSMINSVKKDSLPRLSILIGKDCAPDPQQLDVIADTGAEVCVMYLHVPTETGYNTKHAMSSSQHIKTCSWGQNSSYRYMLVVI